jgi:hypothetical protein
VQEYQAYSELAQRSQAGCSGAENVELFFTRALSFKRISGGEFFLASDQDKEYNNSSVKMLLLTQANPNV